MEVASVLVGVVAACGGASTNGSAVKTATVLRSPSASAAPSLPASLTPLGPDAACLVGRPASVVTVHNLPVALLGHGRRAVVFADQSDQNFCPWLPLAERFVESGYRVALFDYFDGANEDVDTVFAYVRTHGSPDVAFVGASEGAKGVLVAAASGAHRPRAVVSLSPEEALLGHDVAASIPGIRSPLLLVTASDDPLGSTAATAGFAKLSRAHPTRRIVIPGTEHGTDLLVHPSLVSTILAFVGTYAD
jgi:hypothetical protein